MILPPLYKVQTMILPPLCIADFNYKENRSTAKSLVILNNVKCTVITPILW